MQLIKKASRGLNAIDLSNLIYKEVLFNDKCEYEIEDAWMEGHNTAHIVARILK